MTAPAAMPSREQVEAEILPMTYEGADLTECVERVFALFAPILAEKERAEWPPYRISEPEGGWRNHGSFSPEEKAKLRQVAETLAMLDGNAFFGVEASEGQEWYEQYLPEAHALYEGNGGDSGWAGEASFAKPDARALAAEAALAAAEDVLSDLMNAAGHYRSTHSENDHAALTAAINAAADYVEAAAIRAQGE